MGDKIKDYLVHLINSNITSLKNDRESISKSTPDNATYKVSIWSQDLDYSLEKKFTGSISDVIKAAESEFKDNNKVERARADVFMINLCLNDRNYFIPETLWNKYRTI
jgi:hypothetical protein